MTRQQMIVSLIVLAVSGTILLGGGKPPTSGAEESRKPLVLAAEQGWNASFAGCVMGQTYPPDSKSGVVYGGIVKAYRPRKKLEVPFYGMDTLQLSLTPTSHRIFRIFADRGFTGDRESFLSEGKVFLKNIGAMIL